MSAAPDETRALVRRETTGHVALLTLDRPEALNALSFDLMAQLTAALRDVDADPEVRAIVLTGSDRAFCAGADVSQIEAIEAGEVLARDGFAREPFDTLASLRTPLIAAVRGLALGGGCEIALACDLVVAGESARFGVPEVTLGVIPGAGGTQRLVHAIGKAKAMKMLLTGDSVTAEEACAAGLVAEVAPDDEALAAAIGIAERIARNSPRAVELAKDAARSAQDLPLQQGLALERRNFFLTIGSDDQREGVAAFLEKRRPQFTGH
ncbi:enoyl-CoA hydratase-related protein [Nocardioides sp.]|uniref:enoyl-CoA hydratase/isomerase family protein n=1 Tax=Nocardioides sp. TaxID=35761 RepID=UPI00321A52E7